MMERFTWHNQVPGLFFLFFLLFLFGYFQLNFSSSFHLCPPEQSLALLQFKNSTSVSLDQALSIACFGNSYSKTTSWAEGTDCCSWDGVTCDNVTGNVIGLDLHCSMLEGTIDDNSTLFHLLRLQSLAFNNFNGSQISPEFLRLKELTYLNLSYTRFSGLLPQEISHMSKLTHLDLFDCDMTIEQKSFDLLASNLTKLSVLNLGWADRSLIEPFSVLNLSSTITVLDLSGTGRVPCWLFALPSLNSIDLSQNKFTGPIDQFQSPNSLQVVRLDDNQINGTIPNSIFDLVNLTDLNLSSNNLSGTISNISIKYSLPSLKELRFSYCNITEFPGFLRNSEKLEFLDLSNNRIRGRISKSDSQRWKSLTYLDISNNFLTQIEQHPWKNITVLNLQNNTIQGTILVPPPSTRAFLFSNNKLFGQIPPSIYSLSSLEYISLSHNNLSGTIPPCLGNFSTQLTILHLNNNYLQGRIPDAFANGSCDLRSLGLNSNKLRGSFPRYLADCTGLEVVNVGNNMIGDTFPSWLGSLPGLKILVLRSNRFYGPLCEVNIMLPFEALRIIDLSHNEFTGFLPRWIFVSLETMKNVDEKGSDGLYMQGEEDYYQDSVTVTVKGRDLVLKRIITIFTTIDLSSNQFQGEIPQVLGDFKSLIVLNLSHNGLTGSIPVSFANMIVLESLDLSSNKLHGRIPEHVTALASLNLSYNRLWGRIPRGNQFNTFENDSYIGNIHLCGEPLTVTCSNDAVPKVPPSASTDHEEDETTSWFDWKMAKMGYAFGLVIGLSIGYMHILDQFNQHNMKMDESIIVSSIIDKLPPSNIAKRKLVWMS
ncbi:Receptor-like protein 47 [Citrus sinensis]|uniref:Receptor-like protein 47 n=1 Tax=Citrus sinensis TaxID=2711 RepID=A0ACB8M1V2_CITSI|nr:Receptor-like protein 47 [Citrus sinensis]